ncbi:beta-1,4 N-acetylgalactosaminyltransferase 2-like [Saccoglossus kowalevskii]|uniref:Beta-1,4 N-acetylgalactosaminyltransferase 1-like n=1 Tax=Saccoglossus kowalevskii TaxID=10224 RepID=A0ABM0H135_SACKO|nr:PREDICTED: beta-1,4 N-acetylgalactosaminyltransferase 1-like [Saccoglossus kowalevskii]
MLLTQNEECSCPKPVIGPLELDKRLQQRKEFIEWKRQEDKTAEPVTRCEAMSPIEYIGSGITVEPLSSVRLVGIKVHPTAFRKDNPEFKISFMSRRSLGYIYVETGKYALHITGNNTRQITITADDVDDLNTVLKHLVYTSVEYHIRQRDVIDIMSGDLHISINVLTQRLRMPKLYDPRLDGDISNKVTVVSKTFERYDCINKLILSVNKYYPNMSILVADDSRVKQQLNGTNVKHFHMPFLEGLGAGKNLLVSQVRTKYFLWTDDDFVFINETILERFVEKLESPTAELDLVAGYVMDNRGMVSDTIDNDIWKWVSYRREEDGSGCIRRTDSPFPYGNVKEFKNCNYKDVTPDFFLAKTEAVRKVGFDPEFERISHREFFIDGIGYLKIAQCDDVVILHDRERNKVYNKYRHSNFPEPVAIEHSNHVLFKNNLQCYQSWNQFYFGKQKRS